MNTALMLVLLFLLSLGGGLGAGIFLSACQSGAWWDASWSAVLLLAAIGLVVLCPLWNHA